jgi:hypothetical protein
MAATQGPFITSVPVSQNQFFGQTNFPGWNCIGGACFCNGNFGPWGFRHRFWGWGWWSGWGWGLNSYPYSPNAGVYQEDDGSRMDISGGFVGDQGQADDAGTLPGDQDSAAGGSSGPGEQSSQLIFKGGSAYAVKSYWVRDGQVYYRPVYGGTAHASLDQLDLSATVEANSRAGVPFTLSTNPPRQ